MGVFDWLSKKRRKAPTGPFSSGHYCNYEDDKVKLTDEERAREEEREKQEWAEMYWKD